MALIFKTIPYDKKEFYKRLDPKFYFMKETMSRFQGTDIVGICNLGELILKITDGEHAGQTFVKEGVLFLKNSSVKDFDISLNDGFYISNEDHKRLSRSALKPEDILFTTIGHLGSAAIVPKDFVEANMNQNFVKIKIDSQKINPYYLACFLNCKFARMQVSSLMTGNIQSILTYPKIRNIKVLFPYEISIQENIAYKYQKALNLSNTAYRLIQSSLEILNTALGIPEYDDDEFRTFSISGRALHSLDSRWTVRFHLPVYTQTENQILSSFKCERLGKVCMINKGDEPGSYAYSDYLSKDDSDVPFVRTSDLYNYQIDLSPDNFIDALTYDELHQDVNINDILFTKDGKIGEVAIITQTDTAVYQSGISIIRINEYGIECGLTQEYIFTVLISKLIGRYSAKRYSVTASTIPHMKAHFISNIVIPILDFDKIKNITDKVKKAFEMIEEKKQLIKECQGIVNTISEECMYSMI